MTMTTRPRPVRSTRARAPESPVPNRSTRKPRSTRAQPVATTQPRRSTRPQASETTPKRRSTRPQETAATTSTRRIIRTEPPVAPATPSGRKSTRRVIRTEAEEISRLSHFAEKRQQARYLAPLQFAGVLFGVVVVTVFAYGLLGTEEVATPETSTSATETIEVDSTSTNTGILRGD